MRRSFRLLFGAALVVAATSATQAETISADVWADNWFAFYANGNKVKQDSVSINTERSFNKESFSFSATRPVALNFVVKDYKKNDTGLEYIGTPRQQMGDGGFIAQFKDASGKTIAVTNSSWRCLVIHDAPLDKRCEKESKPVAGKAPCTFSKSGEPSGWKNVSFNDSRWPKARQYSSGAVGPKDGYNQVRWDRSAKFIWGPDLETNNTLLCRLVLR